jgi:hypothetical protein
MHLEEHLSNRADQPSHPHDQITQQKAKGDADLKAGNYRDAYQK